MSNPVRVALYQRLTGDPTLTALLSSPTAVYHGPAPTSAAFPLITFHKQAGTPQYAFGGARVDWGVWTVKAVDRAPSASRAEDIAARIDPVLTDSPLVIAGGVLLGVWRDSDIDYVESTAGESYHHVGSLYRLASEPA